MQYHHNQKPERMSATNQSGAIMRINRIKSKQAIHSQNQTALPSNSKTVGKKKPRT